MVSPGIDQILDAILSRVGLMPIEIFLDITQLWTDVVPELNHAIFDGSPQDFMPLHRIF